jgi:hypothetical protein
MPLLIPELIMSLGVFVDTLPVVAPRPGLAFLKVVYKALLEQATFLARCWA